MTENDLGFSTGLVPITSFAQGTPATERLEELLKMTGDTRAVAELQSSQRNGVGNGGLLELLKSLVIGSHVVDYARAGNVPDCARSLEPRGTLDKVRLVCAEVHQRTGTKPSFFGVLKQLNNAR